MSVVRFHRKHAIHVGFVPLIDAAPLIVAAELGYFADEALDVQLERQIGWGNVRDKLTYGQIHASHALIGMVPASVAGVESYHEPLVSLMSLGAGGCAITVNLRLGEMADGPKSPALWRRFLGRPLNLAHVFSCSTHHYLLLEYLTKAGLTIGRDAHLCVMPPPQLAGHLRAATLDGFCVGEPWNTLAVHERRGTIVVATTELAPDHPEKVLAVTRQWYESHRPAAEGLVRAALRGCAFCENPANRSRLTEILAAPQYLALEETVVAKSLSIDEWFHSNRRRPRFRTFARNVTVPRTESVEWIVRKMIQWGHLPDDVDVQRLASASIVTDVYEEAIASLGSEKPKLTNTAELGALR